MEEQWKSVLFDKYEISNLGRIRNSTTKRVLKLSTTKLGYSRITLRINGIKKNYRIHRLVASSFLDNPLGKPDVDHIDRNRSNNAVNNLRWVSKKENLLNRVFITREDVVNLTLDLYKKGESKEAILKAVSKM